MTKGKKTDTRKRPALTVYCESEGQKQRIESAARGNVSRYVLERVLFDDGYADPRHDIAARLMPLADELSNQLHRIGDLVRAVHALRTEVNKSPEHASDKDFRRIVRDADFLIGELLFEKEKRSALDHNLITLVSQYVLACADWEVRQNRAATFQKREKSNR